ncbi:MAG TPA: NAD(P)-dependent alcohol dehydrogenase [Terracidiphilus sp.]|jgi:NADPH:quinone reductase-like Zn-dependent oxidoreductase|nr:NAD(P)-dependent alcohol dehydrogenase [Terracidiphilus sp.]
MKAIAYHCYGPPEVLEFREIEKPAPALDQVLIQVRSASVNPYDWHFLRGTPSFLRLFTGLRRPKSPQLGADVAGIVEAVGSKVTRFKVGDSVFGTCRGAFAEFACATEKTLALKPESLTFEQAAAMPIAGLTALQGLRDSARIGPGQSVLINGAAGGVGTFAVQIAKHYGAFVTGVCSTRNIDMLRSIGADSVIDYTRDDFTLSRQKYDVLFDLVGNRALSEMRRALRVRGTFVGCGGGGPDRHSAALLVSMLSRAVLSPFVSQRLTGVLAKGNPQDLEQLAELAQSGLIKPVVDRNFSLADAARAIRYVEQCHSRGKVTLTIA